MEGGNGMSEANVVTLQQAPPTPSDESKTFLDRG